MQENYDPEKTRKDLSKKLILTTSVDRRTIIELPLKH